MTYTACPVDTTADGRTYYPEALVRAIVLEHQETGQGWRTLAARHPEVAPYTVRRWIAGTRRLYFRRQVNQHDRPDYAPPA